MPIEPIEIRARVEKLVAEHGAYDPLDLLIQLGRLDAEDVVTWRKGCGELLADRLFGDPFKIGNLLANAAQYALSLGLAPLTATPPVRLGQPAGMPADWAGTRYERVAAPQLDLFFDGRSTSLIRQLVDSLARHDLQAAEQALDQLERNDPGHSLVAVAPQLIAMLELDFSDPDRAWTRVDAAAALADAHLGDQSGAYLRPLWTQLAHYLKQDSTCGHHPSAAWARIPDWHATAASLGADPTTLTNAELLMQGIVARRHIGEIGAARRWFCHLCWRYPELGEEIEDLADHHLGLGEIVETWLDLEFDLDWGWQELPCWLLLRGALAPDTARDSQATDAFKTLAVVLRARQDIKARQTLQAVHPGVLKAFLDQQTRS
jgi:hypothetical protein